MPAALPVKVIITHRGAAKAKYTASGWTKIRRAITALTKADKARGVTTRFLAVDSAADAHKIGATVVGAPADSAAIKAFIDKLYAAWEPGYLLLLGGPELLSQVLLGNPLWTGNPDDDPDQFVASDLPYACAAPFSNVANDFRGATRAVGRLPDLMGASDPAALVQLMTRAAKMTPVAKGVTTAVLAVSAKVWQVSTQLSIGKLPGVSGSVHTVPPDDQSWTKSEFAPVLHFVNCHGGEFDPRWYGQANASQVTLPAAIDAALLPGLVAAGTVVATECCYGTAHWPPTAAHGQASVAMTYLAEGAGGVFGASTVAYGPAAANEYADTMARLFAEQVLLGASLGRAALTARQQFVQGQAFLDPTDIKTLAQFDLLGDPSVHTFAVTSGVPHSLPAGVQSRRAVASAVGAALDHSVTVSDATPRYQAGISRTTLQRLLGRTIPADTLVRTFDSSSRADALRAGLGPARPSRVAHTAFVSTGRNRPKTLVVVREEPGSAPEVRLVFRR
jgi:hypothetical protein